jgi:transcriptional regulator with XRE-family HTH domain
MRTKSTPLLPSLQTLLTRAGENIRNARLRRRLSTMLVAKRAHISRPTLMDIETGDPGVSVGAYLRVLGALGLENDFSKIAEDDRLGRKLQDADLPVRSRAPRFPR